jgi:hypothetical protein
MIAEEVVFLTTRLCLSCKNVGFLLRTMAGSDPGRARRLSLVVPSTDTAAVCRFLREERIVLPTIALPETTLSGLAPPPLLVYFKMDSAGNVIDSVIANDGIDIIEHLKSFGVAAAPGQGG